MLRHNTVIESLGIYLPPKAVSTRDVIQGCRRKVRLPLEDLTGIRSRRMAGETEFAVDLAKKAAATCLANSRHTASDIDLVVCCNISRYDGPQSFSFEPSTSIKLAKYLGCENAISFDITNACAGMFTAIAITDIFLSLGLIRCGLVISGEYITHLTLTAQKEIRGSFDPRLACLTLGDAGAAIILEKASRDKVGFHCIDLYTLSKYCPHCIAKATDQEHGGAIMLTDSVRLAAVSTKHAIAHVLYLVDSCGWSFRDIQHLIAHQTSKTSLNSAVRELNLAIGQDIWHAENVVNNLAERGNTASTTHFVALMDNILNHRIRTGDNVLFSITASGVTIGTALYTFDDLPDRLRLAEQGGQRPSKVLARCPSVPSAPRDSARIRIESIGTIPTGDAVERKTLALASRAATICLAESSYERGDLDLLIYAGVYRDDFLSEPAIATLLAGELKINDTVESQQDRKTLAFDVLNSALGVLNSCYIATQFIRSGKFRNALVVTSEIENNAQIFPDELVGIEETGSALLLDRRSGTGEGFGHFVFKSYTDYLGAFKSYTGHRQAKTYLRIDRDPAMENYYLQCIPDAVDQLLDMEGLDITQIKVIFPPQISLAFISGLAGKMNVPRDMLQGSTQHTQDLLTSSLPYALSHTRQQGLVEVGDVGLIISVGAGIQVGCATYYF